MESHVGSVAITIRAPASPAADTRRLAETFAIGVLTRCDDLLERRAPGRVILMRQLDLSLRLLDGALQDDAELDACAHAAATAVEERVSAAARANSAWPPAAAGELAVFDSDIEWRAAHLHLWARGSNASDWRFAALERDGEPQTTISREPRRLRDLLAHLHRRQTLMPTLLLLSADVVAEIADAIGAPASNDTPDRGRHPALPAAVANCVNDLDAFTHAHVAWIRIVAAAHGALAASAADSDVLALARTAFAAFVARQTPDGSDPGAANTHGAPHTVRSTAFGGAFYLVRLMLELGLGEALWRACLPEGAVLARAVAALLGRSAADDDVAAIVGGVTPDEPLPDVSPDQQREVAVSLWQALVQALPRRALAVMPEPVLRLMDTDEGPLLVASEAGGPFVFFAMPAASPAEIRDALDTFLTPWPASAPRPRATPALAGLDRRGRMLPLRRAATPERPPDERADADILRVSGGSLAASALVTQIAGSLGQLFAARAGVVVAQPRDRMVNELLAVPARVVLAPDTMDVRIPMAHTNLAIRRAALDADPGWVPWLNRRVFFTFDDAPA